MRSTRAPLPPAYAAYAFVYAGIGLFVGAGSAASCGGSAFEAGSHDAAADGTTPGVDAASGGDSAVDSGMVTNPPDAPSGDDAPANEDSPPGVDSGGYVDVVADVYFVPDVVEETPPSCVGAFGCAPAVPSGWQGPVELYADTGPAPGCTTNFVGPAFDGKGGLDAGPATCGCTCGPAHGVHCDAPLLSFSLQTTCTVKGCAEATLTPGECKTIQANPITCPDPSGTPFVMSMLPSRPDGGSCAPIPSTSVPPAAWTIAGRACASAFAMGQADCQPGSICAPRPESPYQSALCIVQSGDVPCPGAGYTVKQVLYTAVDDTRGCGPACICGDVKGAQCSGTVSFSAPDSGCGAPATKYALPVNCQDVRDTADFLLTVTPSGGSCLPPSQPGPTGAAAPSGPVTFCCQQ